MKKYIYIAFVFISILVISGCSGNGDEITDKAPEINPVPNLQKIFDLGDPEPDWTTYITATDDVDKNINIEPSMVSTDINMNAYGFYPVNFSVTDSAGNISKYSITISVMDSEAPVITVNENAVTEFDVYTVNDPDWTTYITAHDAVDGDIDISNIEYVNIDDSDVEWDISGEYRVNFTVKDYSGNAARKSIMIKVSNLSEAKPEPVVEDNVDSYVATATSVSADLNISNREQLTSITAVLYRITDEGVDVKVASKALKTTTTNYTFIDGEELSGEQYEIYSSTNYRIDIFIGYDLDNDLGNQEPVDPVDSIEFTTDTYIDPTVEFFEVLTTEEDTEINVVIDDDSLIGEDYLATLYLVNGEELIEQKSEILSGDILNVVNFSDLYSNSNYVLKVTYNYNLHDFEGAVSNFETAEYNFSTLKGLENGMATINATVPITLNSCTLSSLPM